MIDGPYFTASPYAKDAMETEAKNLTWKIFQAHCKQGYVARDSKGNERPLSECNFENVRFVAGTWRIQDKFDRPIQRVRGKQFVLLEKLNRTEKNRFEFYRAAPVGQNCYGLFTIPGWTQIVAKYETDAQTYWGYGDTIEQARAFLGIRLYDEFSDLIHSVACRTKLDQNQK